MNGYISSYKYSMYVVFSNDMEFFIESNYYMILKCWLNQHAGLWKEFKIKRNEYFDWRSGMLVDIYEVGQKRISI